MLEILCQSDRIYSRGFNRCIWTIKIWCKIDAKDVVSDPLIKQLTEAA